MIWGIVVTTAIVVVIFLRFWNLGNVPIGLNIDEASYGWDAYSLLKSGHDQWGIPWPLHLKSFGDYKPAALSYTMIPFIKFLGLNTFSTRLPSALAGLGILVMLYLILDLIRRHPLQNLFLTIVFALSPWSYGISRLFYEPNIALLLFLIGWYFFYRSFQKGTWKFSLTSGIFLALSGYFYVAFRPICLGLLTLVSLPNLKPRQREKWHVALIALIAFSAMSLPLGISMLDPHILTRLKQEDYLRSFGHELIIVENRNYCHRVGGGNDIVSGICYLIWNKPVLKLGNMWETYLASVSPNYLFQTSSQVDITPKGYGAYVSGLAIFYFLGLYAVIRTLFRKNQNHLLPLFLLATYLIAQIPGVLVEQPLIHRNLVGIFFAYLISAYGWHFLASHQLKSNIRSFRAPFQLILGAFLLFQSLQFLGYYHAVFTKSLPDMWNYDSKIVMNYVKAHEASYDKVFFTGFEDAPLYYAFFTSPDPLLDSSEVEFRPPDQQGWIHYARFGKVYQYNRSLDRYLCEDLQPAERVLFVSSPNTGFSRYAEFSTKDFSGDHLLHEIYNIPYLLERLNQEGWNQTEFCAKQNPKS